jgi:hypothetical protein
MKTPLIADAKLITVSRIKANDVKQMLDGRVNHLDNDAELVGYSETLSRVIYRRRSTAKLYAIPFLAYGAWAGCKTSEDFNDLREQLPQLFTA